MRPETILDNVLNLASRGFWVFPLERGKKTPAVKGWQGVATRDEIKLRCMDWDRRGYNIGISTSKFGDGDEGVLAIDIDNKHGKDGNRTLLNLEAEGSAFPATLEHTTPNAGTHLIYLVPKAVKQGVDVLGDGIDIRSQGGYIVGPGSEIDGRPYAKADNGIDLPVPAPDWLVERLGGPAEMKPVDRTPIPGVDPDRAAARAVDYLQHTAGAVQGQGGDLRTFAVAAHLKDLGCDAQQAFDLLLEEWNFKCEPPWEVEDLRAKVASAFKSGKQQPGCLAPEAVFTVQPEHDPEPAESNAQKPQDAVAKAARRALEVLHWRDLKDVHPQPTKWIWEPYFPASAFGILASHPGHGKSFLALQIAVAVAVGLPLFGMPTCGPAGAGVLALEDDANVVHRRLKAIVAAYGFRWTPKHDDLLDANLRVLVRGRTPLEGMDGGAAAHELAGLAQELGEAMRTTQDPPAVLFIDTLNAIHAGDENSNTEVRALVATIYGLHDDLGCSVWCLHHLRKSGTGRNAPSMGDRLDPEQVRGAGALVGSARAVAQFGWLTPTDVERAGLKPVENSTRHYAVLALTKVNDGPQSPWMLLEHAKGSGLWIPTVDGDLALATLRGGGAVEKLDKSEAILLDLAGGMDRASLLSEHFEDTKAGRDLLTDALSRLRHRQKWVVPREMTLTPAGLRKVAELKCRRLAEGGDIDAMGSHDNESCSGFA